MSWYLRDPFPIAQGGSPRLTGWVMSRAETRDTLWADGHEIWVGPGGATAPGRDVPPATRSAWQEAMERGDADTTDLGWRLSDCGPRPSIRFAVYPGPLSLALALDRDELPPIHLASGRIALDACGREGRCGSLPYTLAKPPARLRPLPTAAGWS